MDEMDGYGQDKKTELHYAHAVHFSLLLSISSIIPLLLRDAAGHMPKHVACRSQD